MRAIALLVLSLASFGVAGCLEIDAVDGTLICSNVPNRACPEGFYCAPNNTCWRDGHPFLDMSNVNDMSVPPFKPADLSSPDLAEPTD
ncbi:MAG: hypothetical protein JWN44_3413 [Myxococcales bacterium]|nr:hypothetical protein [Myxococcales bacterium]